MRRRPSVLEEMQMGACLGLLLLLLGSVEIKLKDFSMEDDVSSVSTGGKLLSNYLILLSTKTRIQEYI